MRNFRFGNTVKFMAYKTRESIIYTGNTRARIWCVGGGVGKREPTKNYAPEDNFHAAAAISAKTPMPDRK